MNKLLLLLLPFLLSAQMLQITDSVNAVTLKTQHEKSIALLKDGVWVIAWDKETTRVANGYFEKYPMKKNEQLLIDVSQVPSGILSLFVLPRMRGYKHEILLSYDELYNQTLPYKENSVTILRLKDAKVQSIDVAIEEEELGALLR
jgi:hypothetical protein